MIDISLMIPAKSNVNGIWLIEALEILDLFGSEIGVLLCGVNLIAFSPNINVGF